MQQVDSKSRAHHCLSVFHTICDDYNKGSLVPENPKLGEGYPVSHLRVLQSMTLEAYDLCKYLHKCQPCEATRAYLIFCGKILLRLSHLVHNNRVETEQERSDYFKDFMQRIGPSC